jgi:hypothetical protein
MNIMYLVASLVNNFMLFPSFSGNNARGISQEFMLP